jgi:sugar lactone lactonase YvrE
MRKFDELSDMLIDSGIRHIRDTGNSDDFIKKIQKLSDAGVKSIITLTPSSGLRPDSSYWATAPAYNNASTSVYNIDNFIRKVGRDAIAYVEMNSGLDTQARRSATLWHAADTSPLSDNPSSEFYYINYIKEATAFTAASLRADPALADIPLIGPAFTTITNDAGSAYASTGDLGDLVDYSNIQHYYAGLEPETVTAQGIDFAVENGSEVQAPGKGRIVSEGGESTVNGTLHDTWPSVVQGRYMPRYFLEHFIKGFAITTARELVDVEWNPAAGAPNDVKANNYGLIQNNLAPKPAYTAIKNILSVLKDPGPEFTAESLDYTLGGATANVHSVLFQKRNGDFYLCLWLGIASYDPANGVISDNPPQTVSITVPESILSAQVFTLDDTGAMASSSSPISTGAVSVSVTDRVTIVRLSAEIPGGAASMPVGLRTVSASGQITLKWAPVFEAASYTVKRATAPGGSFVAVASGLTATEYIDTTVAGETVVYYTVTAVAPGGESVSSAPVSAVPYKPIIDNTDPSPEVTRAGSWTNSTSPCYNASFPTYFYGTNSVHDGNTGKGEKTFTYTPTIPATGAYDVYIRWVASGNRTTATPVTIVHANGTNTVSVNQRIDGGAWRLLGTFNFNAGTAGSLTIKNEETSGIVVADAALFSIAIPRPPAGLLATNGALPVSLSWQAVANTDGYVVRRSTSPQGPWDVLATGVTATSFADATAANKTFYYYTVSSVNAGLEGVPTGPMVGTAGMTPVITSATTLVAAEEDSFEYQIEADYLPSSYNATGLPPGLSINDSGLIYGRLTAGGEFTVSLSATNDTGTGTATLSISVIPLTEPPVITSPASATGAVNGDFLYEIKAVNVPLGYAAAGLPEGLSIDEATGKITGTPTTSGTYIIALSVRNKIDVTTTELVITIKNDLQLSTLADNTTAGLVNPASGVFDAAGNLYVVESGAGVIRKITPAGGASTFAAINAVTSVARGPDGVLYAAGSDGNVTKVLADGTLVTPALATGLGNIGGIAVDREGTVYIATTGDIAGGVTVKLIKTITPDGEARNLVLASDKADPSASLSLNNVTNELWFADTAAGNLKQITASTGLMATSVGNLDEPTAVAIDASGLVYVVDTQTGVIHAHDPVSRKTLTVFSNSEGALDHPAGLAIDDDGLLHVMDTGNQTVRIITTSPILVAPLTNRTASVNSTVTLDATMLASPSLTYQWYKDGVPIDGATKANFAISPVKDEDAGNYTVIATNAVGKSTDGMTLTVSGTEPVENPENPGSGNGGGGGATSLWFFGVLGLLLWLSRFVSRRTS